MRHQGAATTNPGVWAGDRRAGVMRGIFVVSWRDVQVMSIRDAGAGYLVTTCNHNTVTRLESEAEV